MTVIYPQQPKAPVPQPGPGGSGGGGGNPLVSRPPGDTWMAPIPGGPIGPMPPYPRPPGPYPDPPTPPAPPIPPGPPGPGPMPPWPPMPGPGGGGGPPDQTTLDIETTINPRPIFDSGLTQQLINQRRAQFQSQAAPDFMRKSLGAREGVGSGAGHMGAISKAQTDQLVQGAAAAPATAWEDHSKNAENILKGQTERESEALGMAKPLIELALGREGMNTQQQAMLIGLLTRIFPGIIEMLGGFAPDDIDIPTPPMPDDWELPVPRPEFTNINL